MYFVLVSIVYLGACSDWRFKVFLAGVSSVKIVTVKRQLMYASYTVHGLNVGLPCEHSFAVQVLNCRSSAELTLPRICTPRKFLCPI